MDNYVEQFKNVIDVVEYTHNLPDDRIRDLVAKYEILCCAVMTSATTYDYETARKIITENTKNYSVYMNKVLYMALVQTKAARESLLDETTNRELKAVFSNSCGADHKILYEALLGAYKQVASEAEITSVVTSSKITSAIDNFGLAVVKNTDVVVDQIEEIDVIPDIDWDIDGDDTWEDDPEFEDESEIEPEDEFEPEDELEFEVEPDAEDEKVTSVEDDNSTDNFGDEDYTSNEKEYIEKLKNIYGMVVGHSVDDILASLEALYKAGFEGGQNGLMVTPRGDSGYILKLAQASENNSGAERSGSYALTCKQDGGSFYDMTIFDTITSMDCFKALKTPAVITDSTHAIPDTRTFSGNSFVCQKLHLQFQNAIIPACTGKQTSIRRWITETNPGEASADERYSNWIKKNLSGGRALVNFNKQIKPWYRWCLENILYQALMDAGVEPKLSPESNRQVTEVMTYMTHNLLNVIVVSDRTLTSGKYIELELKICCGSMLDEQTIEHLVSKLSGSLNLSGSNTIKVEQIGTYENRVLTVRVIFDDSESNQSIVFAGDRIDKIIESGSIPRWNHVLLGRKEDKTYLYWDDFMNPKSAGPSKRIYTIYAASRSGKGIMTSTLVAAALASGNRVFYTDGKPENGAGLGKIAWKRGREAYVFNGTDMGQDPYSGEFEEHTFGIRRKTESLDSQAEVYDYKDKLPKKLFEGDGMDHTKQKEFLGVMRYLKSVYLCCSIVEHRSASQLEADDWQVWFFDELTRMNRKEAELREIFYRYADKLGMADGASLGKDQGKVTMLTGLKINEKTKKYIEPGESCDEGIVYIDKWLRWTANIRSLLISLQTVTLGKSNTNLIFIFQEPAWVEKYKGITTLASLVAELKGTKIIGNGGITDNFGEYGNKETVRYEHWYKKACDGTGWWGISKTYDARKEVMLFKPLSLYLEPWPGAKDIGKCHYIDEYVTKLLGYVGKDPGDVLESAYTYADDFVKQTKLDDSLKSWIYDATKFGNSEIDNSLSTIAKDEVGDNKETNKTGLKNDFSDILDKEDNSGFSGSSTQSSVNDQSLTSEEREMLSASGAGNPITTLKKASDLLKEEHTPVELNDYYTKFIQNKIQNPLAFQVVYRQGQPTKETQATVLYIGNFHYLAINGVTGTTNLQSYLSNLEMLLKSGELKNGQINTLTTIMGLLHSYNNRTLGYDKIPSVSTALQWDKKYGPRRTPQSTTAEQVQNMAQTDNVGFEQMGSSNEPIENIGGQGQSSDWLYENTGAAEQFSEQDLNNSDAFGSPLESATTPIVDVPFGATMTVDNSGNINLTAPRASQEVVRMGDDQILAINPKATSVLDKFRKRLYESANGAAWEYSKLWDVVLKAIEDRFPNRAMVTRIKIQGTTLLVNNTRNIPLNGILGGPYGVRIVDIVSFKALFKRFKYIELLMFDESLMRIVMNEYGASADGIWAMFQSCRALRSIGIIKEGGDTPVIYRREAMNQQADAIDSDMKDAKFKADLESRMARHNPNLGEKSPGYIRQVITPADGSMTKKAYNESKKQFKMAWENLSTDKADMKMRNRLGGFLGRGLLSTLSLGAAAVAWTISEPFRAGKYAMDKRR